MWASSFLGTMVGNKVGNKEGNKSVAGIAEKPFYETYSGNEKVSPAMTQLKDQTCTYGRAAQSIDLENNPQNR